MKAVMTFWSKPAIKDMRVGWGSVRHHLLAWALSAHQAKQHYGHLELVTDMIGHDILVRQLRLPFDSVRVELDVLDNHDHRVWVACKLMAFLLQDEPFIHLDSDVFLWNRPDCDGAELFAQSPETLGRYNYMPTIEFMDRFYGSLPESFKAERPLRPDMCAYNAGIIGGHNVDLIVDYAKESLAGLMHPENQGGDSKMRAMTNFVWEQFMFGAHARYYGVPVQTLLTEIQGTTHEEECKAKGYAHLFSRAPKTNGVILRRLENRAAKECPDSVAIIDRYLA